MNRKIRLLKLSLRMLLKINKHSILFLNCILIATILPVILYGVSQSIINQVSESKKDVYGDYTDILYLDHETEKRSFNTSDDEFEQLLPGFHYRSFGVLYIVFQTNIDTATINLGYADKQALELGRIKLQEGCLPERDNEIAITFSVINELEDVNTIGDQITIGNKQFTLVGIVSDYGALWPRGEKQQNNESAIMNAFVTKTMAENIYNDYDQLNRQILVKRIDGIINQTENNDIFLHNHNVRSNEANNYFIIPKGFMVILYICSILILYNILSLSKESIKRRMNIYYLLGMQRQDTRYCFLIEYTIIGCVGILFGMILGTVSTITILSVLSEYLNTTIPFYFNNILILISIFILFALLFVEFIFCITNLNINNNYNIKIKNQKTYKYKKTNLFRLTFLEYRLHTNIIITLGTLIIFSIILLEYGNVYRKIFIKSTKYVEIEGKMPQDFDFEFLTIPKSQTPRINSDLIYNVSSYEKYGADEDIIKKIENEEILKEVKKYKEVNNMWILLKQGVMDKYLDSSDFYEDGVYTHYPELNIELLRLFDYNNVQTIMTKMVGYSKEELQSFSKYVTKGEINFEKISSGEEVILMAPAFTLTLQSDGGIRKDRVNPNLENAINDTLFNVGDQITLSKLLTDKNDLDAVNAADALKYLYRQDKKVTIGAIIPYYVGWWERTVTMGESYYILTLNEAFENIGYHADYNRITIYTDSDIQYRLIQEKVNSYLSKLPYMNLEDRIDMLANYRQLNFIINLFVNVLMVIVVFAVTISISAQMLTKTKLNIKKYALLRLNGMSFKKLIKIWILQIFIIDLIAMFLSIPMCIALIYISFPIKPEIFNYVTISDFIRNFSLVTLILYLSLFPSIQYVKKIGIRRGL